MSRRPHLELPTPSASPHGGLFVAFEGGERVGKSTQVARLGAHLSQRLVPHLLTREPGGNPAAEAIREVVLHPRYTGLDARAEALLFAAARGEHVRAVVRPALDRGEVVVTDRYIDSSVAYQGVARALGHDVVEWLSLWATDGLVPDLTVLLDADERTGLGRVTEPDRLEAEPGGFHALVRKAFLGLAARAPHRYLVVDATEQVDVVAEKVAVRVDALLETRAPVA